MEKRNRATFYQPKVSVFPRRKYKPFTIHKIHLSSNTINQPITFYTLFTMTKPKIYDQFYLPLRQSINQFSQPLTPQLTKFVTPSHMSHLLRSIIQIKIPLLCVLSFLSLLLLLVLLTIILPAPSFPF